MARILLPQPPRSRGLVGLITGLVLVGWTAYLFLSYKGPSLLSPIQPVEKGPQYVEIDLRGPKYDEGRYAGFTAGREAVGKGFTIPAEKVLAFQASEAAGKLQLDAPQADDYGAGYLSGYRQALNREKAEKVGPASSKK